METAVQHMNFGSLARMLGAAAARLRSVLLLGVYGSLGSLFQPPSRANLQVNEKPNLYRAGKDSPDPRDSQTLDRRRVLPDRNRLRGAAGTGTRIDRVCLGCPVLSGLSPAAPGRPQDALGATLGHAGGRERRLPPPGRRGATGGASGRRAARLESVAVVAGMGT